MHLADDFIQSDLIQVIHFLSVCSMMINICSMSVFWQVLSKNLKNERKSTKVVKKQQHTETYIYIVI